MALKEGWGGGVDRKALYSWNLNVRTKEQGRGRERQKVRVCWGEGQQQLDGFTAQPAPVPGPVDREAMQ